MKEKKIKKKHFHKIPAVILAVFVLVSVFALSAFADSTPLGCPDEDCYLSHFLDTGIDGVIFLECNACGAVGYFYAEGYNNDWEMMDGPYKRGEYYEAIAYLGEDEEGNYITESFYFYPYTLPTTPNGIAQTITKDITSAVGVFLKGIGSTLVDFFDNVVLTTNAEGQRVLSTFAGWTLAFVGIGFGAGLLRKLLKKVN